MEFKNILTENKNGILILTINRPDKLNALNLQTIKELHSAIKNAETDNAVKAVIVTGSGSKAFVAGADISEFAEFSVSQGKEMAGTGHKLVFNLIENQSKPYIAAINGFALGGGLELAMACHIRIASETAKMGLPEVSLGVIPGYGGTQRLPQLVGKGKAFEMIMTGDMIPAEEALQWGLVNKVVSSEALLQNCEELAAKILTRSPIAVGAAIRSINANYKEGINGFQAEIEEFGKCFGTGDYKEGTKAFVEKRRPVFPGK